VTQAAALPNERGGQTAEMQGVATMKRALTFQPLETPYPFVVITEGACS
jgi:hypothetical protein